ncbi:MAG: hypothetical protein CL489_03800 [Acidobacteria bacterium]|nr:hypothetical protein [Acidobacteriota bacterium]
MKVVRDGDYAGYGQNDFSEPSTGNPGTRCRADGGGEYDFVVVKREEFDANIIREGERIETFEFSDGVTQVRTVSACYPDVWDGS